MIKRKLMTAICITSAMFTFISSDIYAAEKGQVTASALNIRSGPSTDYSKITSVSRGTTLDVLEEKNGWSQVKLSNGKEGWASSQYIDTDSTTTDSSYNEVAMNKSGRVTASSLNIRSGPSTSYSKVTSLSNGSTVNIVAESNDWYKLKLSNGQYGWASSQYITLSSGNDTSGSSENDTASSTGRKKMTVEATAYTGYTVTSTGDKPRWGTIAVDPKVIPYGTKVYIPQFDQVFIANNTGGAIKGNKIDIYMDSEAECNKWGRKTIEIEILE